MKRGVIMNVFDNVATVLDDVEKGETVTCKGLSEILEITVHEQIMRGHKVALSDIQAGKAVTKYGFEIGYALCTITRGSYVHVHNVGSKKTEE
jgi:altronate hydrolase